MDNPSSQSPPVSFEAYVVFETEDEWLLDFASKAVKWQFMKTYFPESAEAFLAMKQMFGEMDPPEVRIKKEKAYELQGVTYLDYRGGQYQTNHILGQTIRLDYLA